MSSKMGFLKKTNKINSFEWTSDGTARSHFEDIVENESLKKQIFVPSLTKSLKKLKQQLAKINIGSELFYQAFDFLVWVNKEFLKEKMLEQRFTVLLSGVLLMRKENIYGSICIPWKILKKQIFVILLNSGYSKKELTPQYWKKWLLSSLKSSQSRIHEKTIFFENNSLIYFYKNWLLELELLNLIKDRANLKLNPPPRKLVNNSIESVLEMNPVCFGEEAIKLSLEQKKAISLAISSPFLIITGGPGTGKTSLVVILLRVLKRLGLANNPALASPTGRSSKRMSDSVIRSINSIKKLYNIKQDKELLEVASKAKTLHRLLGYSHSNNYFKHHEYDPLENDLLIIDEGSMIDQNIMIRLLKAASSRLPHQPPVSRVILLGDADQLPSVGSGAVLSELTTSSNKIKREDLDSQHFQIVRLTRSYRQEIEDSAGRNILGVAKTIKNLVESKNPELLFKKNTNLNQEIIHEIKSLENVVLEKVSFLNQVNSEEKLKDFAKWWVENFLNNKKFIFEIQREFYYEGSDSDELILKYLFDYLDRCRILTLTQVFSTGARSINNLIREIWLSKNDTKNLFSEHYPGEPVMVMKNDYLNDLFNGDIGIFLKFVNPDSGELELKVVFLVDGVFKTFYANELFNLQTAYAITVHKSQGSEYVNLALILPELTLESNELDPKIQKFREIMTSEMLYTAITRSKKSVLILGKKKVLEFLALNKVLRFSGLGINMFLNKTFE